MSPMDIAPALEALDRHAAKLQAELDTLATIRKMLLATLDADEPDLSPVAPESSPDPLAHRCPACGALPGADCVGLDFGVFHSARPGTGWRQDPQAKPEPAPIHDMRRMRKLGSGHWEVTAGGQTVEVTRRYSTEAGRQLYFPDRVAAGFPTLVAVQDWLADNA